MAKEAILLSFFLGTNNLLSIKSSLKGLVMLFRPPTLSTTPMHNPVTPKAVRNVLKKNNIRTVIKKKCPYSNSNIVYTVLNLPSILKIR